MSEGASWRSVSAAAALLASTAQRRDCLPCLVPALQVTSRSDNWESLMFSSLLMEYICFLPGFYCLEGSETAAPTQTTSGDVCPAGHHCVGGSSVPTPCPAGFHRNETGGKGEGDCYRCPAGKREMIWCRLGFRHKGLLPLFKKTLTLFEPFLSGWFQESSGQTECLPCPPGFHCQPHSLRPLLCPAGYICPDKSSDTRPLPCPRGTYNPSQGLASAGNRHTVHDRQCCWENSQKNHPLLIRNYYFITQHTIKLFIKLLCFISHKWLKTLFKKYKITNLFDCKFCLCPLLSERTFYTHRHTKLLNSTGTFCTVHSVEIIRSTFDKIGLYYILLFPNYEFTV